MCIIQIFIKSNPTIIRILVENNVTNISTQNDLQKNIKCQYSWVLSWESEALFPPQSKPGAGDIHHPPTKRVDVQC